MAKFTIEKTDENEDWLRTVQLQPEDIDDDSDVEVAADGQGDSTAKPTQQQQQQLPLMEPQPDPKAPALSSGATANIPTTSPVSMTSLTTGHSASIIAGVLAGRSVVPES